MKSYSFVDIIKKSIPYGVELIDQKGLLPRLQLFSILRESETENQSQFRWGERGESDVYEDVHPYESELNVLTVITDFIYRYNYDSASKKIHSPIHQNLIYEKNEKNNLNELLDVAWKISFLLKVLLLRSRLPLSILQAIKRNFLFNDHSWTINPENLKLNRRNESSESK